MAKKQVVKKGGVGKVLAVGAGLAAVGGVAYAMLGPAGKKNQKKVKVWALKMQKEVKSKMKEVKDVTEPVYAKLVDEVSKNYANAKGVSEAEVREAVLDMKKHWKVLSQDAKKIAKTVKKVAKKQVAKVVKKPVQKTTKKVKK